MRAKSCARRGFKSWPSKACLNNRAIDMVAVRGDSAVLLSMLVPLAEIS